MNRESHRGVLLDVNLVVLVEAVCTTWLAVTLNNETFTEPSARTHHSRLTTCVAVTLTNEMLAAALRPTHNSQQRAEHAIHILRYNPVPFRIGMNAVILVEILVPGDIFQQEGD